MKKFLFSILLLSTTISSVVFAADELVSIDFTLTEKSKSSNGKVSNVESTFEIVFDYDEEIDYQHDDKFKAVFQVVDVDGLPQVTVNLYDFDENQKLFNVGNMTLHTNWGNKSELTWWYKTTKYSMILIPTQSVDNEF